MNCIKKGIGDIKGTREIVLEIEDIFKSWLEYSDLEIEEFLELSEKENFEIVKHMDGEATVYVIGNLQKEGFLSVGQPFVAQSEEDEVNMSLLLIYIAKMLDDSYINNPSYPDRKVKGYDYFYRKVKDFLKVSSR